MLRDHLTKFVDENDRLLVAEVDLWATRSALVDMNKI